MTYVIVEPCIGTKNASCVDVCPVSCIYEAEDMYYINPDECIECGACEPECPVNAIFHESAVPDVWKSFIQNNRELSGLGLGSGRRRFAPAALRSDRQTRPGGSTPRRSLQRASRGRVWSQRERSGHRRRR